MNKYKANKVSVRYIPHQKGSELYGAYKSMDGQVKGNFIGTPGDVIAEPDAYIKAMEVYEKTKFPVVTTLSPKLDEVDSHAAGLIDNNVIVQFVLPKSPEIKPPYLRDMMIYAADTRLFTLIGRYSSETGGMSPIFVKGMKDGIHFGGSLYEDQWIHLADEKDLLKSMSNNPPQKKVA